eukprot:TRINITY_DN10667_c1_g1_i1.p1 TRINITY_DN10667_c1_g1~~TRINITY_DN10667_c1_g1_i1.p1  ORF type:complete len:316 (+),score=128.38 TRINITY_DN10667_c1_g1_i1:113-1060(+)
MARRGHPMPTGRIELLNWLNDFLESDYTRVEQACDGVAYAQIIDCAVGHKMPLHKFNFAARNEDDYARNLSILQTEFKKLNIEHPVAVDKLSRGRFQDNNEFLQWCFAFLHNCVDPPHEYPAVARRQEALLKQVRCKGRGGLPLPSVKTELAYGIDLDASPYPEPGSATRASKAVEEDADWQRGAPAPPTGRRDEAPAPAGAAPPRLPQRAPPARYVDPLPVEAAPIGGGGEAAEDIEALALCRELATELRAGRAEQTRRRANLESLVKQRNSMWQQLRTIEELLKNFHVLNGDTMNYISDVLFENDTRLAPSLE